LTEWTKYVVNSVEEDLRKELRKIILENPNWGWEQLSLQDVYGCAINQLAPYYTKRGSISEFKYSIGELRSAINYAMARVKANPIHIPKP
jgi:endo-beta-N-acetylglucosaminidase D